VRQDVKELLLSAVHDDTHQLTVGDCRLQQLAGSSSRGSLGILNLHSL